ncbi:MAG: hypothetical protein HDS66_07180 [Bacteroidales bacterium]|nr:hypothetical protein [Bacteroidales bacterium]
MEKEKQTKVERSQGANDTQLTAEQEAQARAELIKEHNLRFYTEGCEVPADALKPIRAGRLKGMSDVNPMWRMKRMTEIFGPIGFGWKYEIVKQWTEAYGNEVKCFCIVNLYVRDPETKEWSEPIPGSGGSAIVSMESKGAYVNDEGYKMALTDALSIAMKPLGIGGNIWYGPKATGHNESKYETYTQANQAQQSGQPQGAAAVAFTGAQLNQAIQEMNAATTEEQFTAIWDKWAKASPAMAQQGTEFYKAACAKINAIKNPAAQ